MSARIAKVLIGIFLFPVAIAATFAFSQELATIKELHTLSAYFLKGVVIYLIMHLVLYKPSYFYVLGHELAHAIATLICGGKVNSIHVSGRGGAVSTTKSNFFIALFPYFFPTYTIFVWLVYFLVSLFRDISMFAGQFLFIIGFTLSLHLVMTIDSMKIKQSDILKTGYLFSVSLIYTLNILLLGLILSLVFKDFSFSAFFQTLVNQTSSSYFAIYEYLFL